MSQDFPMKYNFKDRISGRGFLAIATIMFGLSNSVARRLSDLGKEHSIDGRNPISFCNSLFVGNLCSLIILSIVYYKDWNPKLISQIELKDWILLTIVAILSGALAPALVFTALNQTMVNNVILVGRIEPPLALALSILILRVKTNSWVIGGSIFAFAGVGLTILLQAKSGVMIGRGEVLTIIAAIASAVSSVITKVELEHIPLGVFTVYRTFLGTLVFGAIVVLLFGFEHFTDVFSPFLWQLMLVYSAVIVVGGQLCWYTGIKKSTSADISIANSFTPISGLLGSYFILGQVPNMAQYIGGSVIMLGIALGLIGSSILRKMSKKEQVYSAIAMDMESGFKGI
jgi:drug/metabolite transporter (DMT)-like permease